MEPEYSNILSQIDLSSITTGDEPEKYEPKDKPCLPLPDDNEGEDEGEDCGRDDLRSIDIKIEDGQGNFIYRHPELPYFNWLVTVWPPMPVRPDRPGRTLRPPKELNGQIV